MDIYKKIEKLYATKYSAKTTTRKAIGDFNLDEHHAVNVKSNNIRKNNYSPNLISATRLLDYLQKTSNKLSFIFVDYEMTSNSEFKIISDSGLVSVEHINWKCMTIQAQGRGVIQLSGPLEFNTQQTREQFVIGFRSAYEKYVEREKRKLEQLVNRLELMAKAEKAA